MLLSEYLGCHQVGCLDIHNYFGFVHRQCPGNSKDPSWWHKKKVIIMKEIKILYSWVGNLAQI